MKRGFTIIEVLVASLLLGMLVSILTMMFNQSSVSWRTGVAGVSDLDEVRQNMAELCDEADAAYVWNGEIKRTIGLWDESGTLRRRAWNADGAGSGSIDATLLAAKASSVANASARLSTFGLISVGTGDSGGSVKTYTVNVKSAGPDREFGTYDDIWSYPDEIQ